MNSWIHEHLLGLEEAKREIELEVRQHDEAIARHQSDRCSALTMAQTIHAEMNDWRTLIRFRAEAGHSDAAGLVQAAAERLGLGYLRRRSPTGWAVVVELEDCVVNNNDVTATAVTRSAT